MLLGAQAVERADAAGHRDRRDSEVGACPFGAAGLLRTAGIDLPFSLVLGSLISAVIGIFFGVYPAWRAVR
jgi:uncharacterized protein YceK